MVFRLLAEYPFLLFLKSAHVPLLQPLEDWIAIIVYREIKKIDRSVGWESWSFGGGNVIRVYGSAIIGEVPSMIKHKQRTFRQPPLLASLFVYSLDIFAALFSDQRYPL